MAIKVTVTYTRQSVDTPWYEFSNSFKTVMQGLVESGKVSHSGSVNEDGLSFSSSLTFSDADTLTTILNNSILQNEWAARDQYCQTNSITFTKERIDL